MGLLFMLAADCETKEKADAFAAHFNNKKFTLKDGFVSELGAGIFQQGGAYWVRVTPSGCGQSGLTAEMETRFNELAEKLYNLLLSAPAYRYALVEVEAEAYRDYDELLEDAREGAVGIPGLVVSQNLWTALGSPDYYEDFAPGYKWIPHEKWKAGEY